MSDDNLLHTLVLKAQDSISEMSGVMHLALDKLSRAENGVQDNRSSIDHLRGEMVTIIRTEQAAALSSLTARMDKMRADIAQARSEAPVPPAGALIDVTAPAAAPPQTLMGALREWAVNMVQTHPYATACFVALWSLIVATAIGVPAEKVRAMITGAEAMVADDDDGDGGGDNGPNDDGDGGSMCSWAV